MWSKKVLSCFSQVPINAEHGLRLAALAARVCQIRVVPYLLSLPARKQCLRPAAHWFGAPKATTATGVNAAIGARVAANGAYMSVLMLLIVDAQPGHTPLVRERKKLHVPSVWPASR